MNYIHKGSILDVWHFLFLGYKKRTIDIKLVTMLSKTNIKSLA